MIKNLYDKKDNLGGRKTGNVGSSNPHLFDDDRDNDLIDDLLV